MASGRTMPALVSCETAEGQPAGDYVVKLKAGIDRRETGLACEWIASRLATYFGIPTPEPAVVELDAQLVGQAVSDFPSKADILEKSTGLNFGSRLVKGASTWPAGFKIPAAMWDLATRVFAFDALLQNPDRRAYPANLFIKGEDIVVFDHELAFSFLLDLARPSKPWGLERAAYLRDHIFYRHLHKKEIDWAGFQRSLEELPMGALGMALEGVPDEWNNGSVGEIERHLLAAAEHAADFVDEVRRVLA